LGGWLGEKQVKPGFDKSVTIFMVEVAGVFNYLNCFPDCKVMLLLILDIDFNHVKSLNKTGD
jgi:hypothetical protein